MNPRRVASLLRELADALEESEPANDAEPPRKPVRRARPVTDLEKARARKALRKVGLDV